MSANFTYSNGVVLAVVKERKLLARDNARLKVEVNQLKETTKMQADRIKEHRYDMVEGHQRIGKSLYVTWRSSGTRLGGNKSEE